MKKLFYIMFLTILNSILSYLCFAQFNDKPIRLSPEIGDTINLVERNYYYLFPVIKDFHYAIIYLNSDSTTVTKIICRNDEELIRDTVINNSTDFVGNLKAYIRQINAERLENYNSINKITVTKLAGNKYSGKLLAVQDSSFLVCPDTISYAYTFNFIKTYVKLNLQEVESVLLEFGYWSDVGIAASLGGVSGLVIGGNQPVGPNQIYGDLTKMSNTLAGAFLGMLAGAAEGFGVGLILTTPDETIEINSTSDIQNLKEYLAH